MSKRIVALGLVIVVLACVSILVVTRVVTQGKDISSTTTLARVSTSFFNPVYSLIVSGSPPLEIGQSMSYGMYSDGSKIGNFTISVAEKTTFQGRECFKVTSEGSYQTENLAGFTITYSSSGYALVDTSWNVKYCKSPFSMSISNGFTTEMSGTAEFTYDYDARTMHVRMTSDNATMENEIAWPEDISPPEWKVGSSRTYNFTTDNNPLTITIEVAREESVTVPVGTFNCYVVEVTSSGAGASYYPNATLWVDKQNHTLIQQQHAPGATITLKLKSYSGF